MALADRLDSRASPGDFLTAWRSRVTIEFFEEGERMVRELLLPRGGCGDRSAQRPRLPARRPAAALTLFMSAAMVAVVPSAGAGVLDQSQPIISGVSPIVSEIQHDAQTFTNGITGSLDQVDLGVAKASATTVPLRVEIRAMSAGVPVGPTLAHANVSPASVNDFNPRFVSVPLAPPASVTAGVQYAIVLSSSSCGARICYLWSLGPQTDPYPAGSALVRPTVGGAWQPSVGDDFAFKTYVGPPVVRPTSKAECKKGGWRRFTNPSFKNQGQCVAYVNHHDGKGKDDEKSNGNGKNDEKSQGKKKGGKKK